MQKTYTSIIGMPVIDASSGALISLIQDIVIDPDKGKVVAFRVHNNKIIVPFDIERITDTVYLNDIHSMIDASEVPRVIEIVNNKMAIYGAKVVTQTKKVVLGRIIDYSIETKTFSLESLYIAKSFFFIRYAERIIAARRIVRVERGVVWIEDDRETVTETLPSAA